MQNPLAEGHCAVVCPANYRSTLVDVADLYRVRMGQADRLQRHAWLFHFENLAMAGGYLLFVYGAGSPSIDEGAAKR